MSRFKMEVGVLLILEQNGKVLLLQRANTGWEDGKYALIGGHMDGGESVKQAMIREAYEEAGITLNEKDLKVVGVSHVNMGRELVLYYLATNKYSGKIVNNEPNKCSDIGFFDLHNLPANTLKADRVAINNYLKGIPFYEVGFNSEPTL